MQTLTQSPNTTNYAVAIPTFEEFARVSAAEVQWLSLALGEPIKFFQFLGVYLSRAQSYILLHGFKVRTHSKVNKQIVTFYSKVNTFIG